jgi:hypothetical protein
MKFLFLITIISFFFINTDLSDQIDLAGSNKSEIKKALRKVSKDEYEGMVFLIKNMPSEDLKTLKSDFLLENSRLAYKAWRQSPWHDDIPKSIFFNYILPYANLNEKRELWRKTLQKSSLSIIENSKTISEAVVALNHNLFKEFGVIYSTNRPKADQSPSESIKAGMASCTGLSILLIDACRSVGIPARFVGTPSWINDSGNHSWIEIWDNGWYFTGAAEPVEDKLNEGWFLEFASKGIPGNYKYGIFAATWEKTETYFPMDWLPTIETYNSIDITREYNNNKISTDLIPIRIRTKGENGKRRSVNISVKHEGKIIFEGVSKNESNDSNDILTFMLEKGETFTIHAQSSQIQHTVLDEATLDFIVN